jgi:hypothetical protein
MDTPLLLRPVKLELFDELLPVVGEELVKEFAPDAPPTDDSDDMACPLQ